MQFNRDEAGVMHPLPKPSVDTGMGLERVSAVLQHVHANYEIDLFQALIKAAARETIGRTADLDSPSLKVLADHIRACSFLLADGVIPGNDGRGYVLRRIIRRAIRHGWKLGAREAFFHKLVPDLVAEMGAAYPELVSGQTRVMDILKQEEDRFFTTIEHGMAIVEAELQAMDKVGKTVFDGATAFKLHDTYGFPLDLTADICRERSVTVDAAGLRRRHGAAEGTGARRRQVQDGRQPRIRRRGDHLPRLRRSGAQGHGAGAVQGRRAGQGTERRRDGRGGARRHAVLRRVRRPGRRPRRTARPAAASSPSRTRRRSRPPSSATTAC